MLVHKTKKKNQGCAYQDTTTCPSQTTASNQKENPPKLTSHYSLLYMPAQHLPPPQILPHNHHHGVGAKLLRTQLHDQPTTLLLARIARHTCASPCTHNPKTWFSHLLRPSSFATWAPEESCYTSLPERSTYQLLWVWQQAEQEEKEEKIQKKTLPPPTLVVRGLHCEQKKCQTRSKESCKKNQKKGKEIS